MNIAFYIDEMNFRGVANSTYQYSFYNQKILKNKSIIFYNQKNKDNQKEVINKFKKKFKLIAVDDFQEIDNYKNKFKLDYLYVPKGGEKDTWVSQKIKTLIHSVYPQKLNQIHGYKYVYISEWLSNRFSNKKVPYVPLIIQTEKISKNLKKKLKIGKKQIVFGCHGGSSSFDLKFVKNTIIEIVKKKKDITFLFLNINKFCSHPRIIFLKGTSNENYKKKFINSCDAMIYGRSLGESFGIACGEFSLQGKKILSYKFNRHKSHIYNISNGNYSEYGSRKKLFALLSNFKKINYRKKNKYFFYNPKYVMKRFENIFLKNHPIIRISVFDLFLNYLNFAFIHYQYLRHKLYNHYYNYFESKFLLTNKVN
jgi:hypothetical protein